MSTSKAKRSPAVRVELISGWILIRKRVGRRKVLVVAVTSWC
jgi:hypothetical protein